MFAISAMLSDLHGLKNVVDFLLLVLKGIYHSYMFSRLKQMEAEREREREREKEREREREIERESRQSGKLASSKSPDNLMKTQK